MVLCDMPFNNFSSLANTINKHWSVLSQNGELNIYPTMAPRNFYERIIPDQSVNIGFSFAALHYLQGVPPAMPSDPTVQDIYEQLELDGIGTTMLHNITQGQEQGQEQEQWRLSVDERQAQLASIAHNDLVRFLQLRACEFRPKGSFVFSLIGQDSSGKKNGEPLVSACRAALIEMIDSGQISQTVARAFEVLVYDRSMSEVELALKAVKGEWAVEEYFEKEILHPAAEMLGRPEDPSYDTTGEAKNALSKGYARVTVDWMMATIGGYFVKALRLAKSETLTHEQAQQQDGDKAEMNQETMLLGEWTRRTIDIFLRDSRDAIVVYCFIFVKLRKL